MLAILVGILSFLIIILVAYIVLLQLQLLSINRQLYKRLTENTRQPISLELLNKELNALAININRCLKVEEILRIDSLVEEKRFKELIANISHDLRTPLTAIKGYQQLIGKGTLSDEQKQKLLVAQKYADELGGLVENFFEYSYLVNADQEINIEEINLTNLVTECLAESVTSFEENNLTVRFEEAAPVLVLADRKMTNRIIQNLIRNCTQYSAGEIRVQLLTTRNAVISFSNPVKNASTIDVKQLFDRFYTADKARRKSTGLGLSIVKLLAEQMGGNVSALLRDDVIEIDVEFMLSERVI
jgi:signal transduction histidine kinase